MNTDVESMSWLQLLHVVSDTTQTRQSTRVAIKAKCLSVTAAGEYSKRSGQDGAG